MSFIDWNSVRERTNTDGEFLLHARFWESTVRFGFGDQSIKIVIEQGRLDSVEHCDLSGTFNLEIWAPVADWQEMLASIPRPFYQDLFPATLYHDFEFDGERLEYCAYYPAIRRLIEIIREEYNNAT